MRGHTAGVKTLLGDPKQAIIKIAIPMIIASTFQTLYNVVDAIWVAGLGADALASVGFFFPFFMLFMAVGMGLGVGGGSAISRRIGARDKEGASSVATHTVVIMILLAFAFTLPFLLFIEPIYVGMGAGRTMVHGIPYAQILLFGTVFIFFPSIGGAILRSEGDAKRAGMAIVLGAVLNIILDPIFIYVLGMGVPGAALATVISMAITSAVMFRWLFMKKDTFVTFKFKGFHFDRPILRDIFKVGFPASIQAMTMSLTMFIMNMLIVGIGGTDGIAVFSTGWRIATIAMMPVFGIATAVVAVIGAAYGARDYLKLERGFMYGVRLGVLIEIPTFILMILLAPMITSVFTQGPGAHRIEADLTLFLMTIPFFFPSMVWGMFSSSMFQGIGKGMYALVATIIRTVILAPPLAFLLAYVYGMGLSGIWWGIVLANIIGANISYSWARYHMRKLREKGARPSG